MIERRQSLDEGKFYAFQNLRVSLKDVKDQSWRKKLKKRKENQLKIDHKVEQQKTTQKNTQNLLSFEQNGRFDAAISRICFILILNRVLQKNGKKRWDIHWVHWFFWCKKWSTKKSKNQQSNIACDLRKVCYFLTINQKCSLAIEVKKNARSKEKEQVSSEFLLLSWKQANVLQETTIKHVPCALKKGLEAVFNLWWIQNEKRTERRNKKERRNRNMWALDFLQHPAHTYLLMVGF